MKFMEGSPKTHQRSRSKSVSRYVDTSVEDSIESPDVYVGKEAAATGGGPALRFQTFVSQGGRPYQEDRHSVKHNVGGISGVTALAVYDGHGGARASDYCNDHILDETVAHPLFWDDPGRAMHASMLKANATYSAEAEKNGWIDGSTALVAVLNERRLTVANIGDCRCVLGRQVDADAAALEGISTSRDPAMEQRRKSSGTVTVSSRVIISGRTSPSPITKLLRAFDLSIDHKPSVESEQARIREFGGEVAKSRDEYESGMLKRAAMAAFGPNKDHLPARVYPGGLSVSRTIGDVVVKKKAPGCVGEEPDLFTTIIDPCCEFLIMACDGIWDVLTSEDAVREVALASASGRDASTALEEMARLRHSQDNVTVMVIFFDWGDVTSDTQAQAVAGPPPDAQSRGVTFQSESPSKVSLSRWSGTGQRTPPEPGRMPRRPSWTSKGRKSSAGTAV
mmetsp:Transcript_96888/g.277035  ORF Transcript_96888/g.277035 Transcript_96888/m.277035 type:complete len:451 (-) Transcript_96888:158-1510(-)